METKFFRCNTCGNVIVKIVDSGVPPHCCGKEMTELVPKTEDVGTEKHLPVVTRVDECTLRIEIGSVPHPMESDHFIQWIYVETKKGGQFVKLPPNGTACACFCICNDEPIAVYEYCNVHGLWKKDLKYCEKQKSCSINK